MARHAHSLPLPRRLLSHLAPTLTGRTAPQAPDRPRYASAVRRVGPSLVATGVAVTGAAGEEAEQARSVPRGLLHRASTFLGLGLVVLSLIFPGVVLACGVGPSSSTPAPAVQSSSPCGTLYVVQAGDTLSAIALRCQVSLASLQYANPQSDPLAIGRILAVPGGAAAPTLVPVSQSSDAAPSISGTTRYVIRSGDTLSAVALRFSTTVAALARYNGLLDPNRLSIGQVLLIPSAS